MLEEIKLVVLFLPISSSLRGGNLHSIEFLVKNKEGWGWELG